VLYPHVYIVLGEQGYVYCNPKLAQTKMCHSPQRWMDFCETNPICSFKESWNSSRIQNKIKAWRPGTVNLQCLWIVHKSSPFVSFAGNLPRSISFFFFSSRLLPWLLCGTLCGNFGWRYIYEFTGPLSCYLFWIFLQMNAFLFFFYFKSLNVLILFADVGEFAFIFASRNGVLSYVCRPIGPFRWTPQIIHISIIIIIMVLHTSISYCLRCLLASLTFANLPLPPPLAPVFCFVPSLLKVLPTIVPSTLLVAKSLFRIKAKIPLYATKSWIFTSGLTFCKGGRYFKGEKRTSKDTGRVSIRLECLVLISYGQVLINLI
jgi:hypothetical protein